MWPRMPSVVTHGRVRILVNIFREKDWACKEARIPTMYLRSTFINKIESHDLLKGTLLTQSLLM